jgi:hypothetical protein
MQPISHTELPPEALEAFSEDQKSYLDEFSFYRSPSGRMIECWYAGEQLAFWDNQDQRWRQL